MKKTNKHPNFGDMPFSEIEKWEKEQPVIVMLDNGDKNCIAFLKSESFTGENPERDSLVILINNTRDKNTSIFSYNQIQRLKQFLNEHF
ncbi:hypothetical protein H4K35_09905 [Myroides sp. NP-2]|uniref:hypothetical protein n=1 Tax=Myroides sp. NP-2 TaxID=2759945 RepID=UPI0015FB614B|nr:hypothetical protein [Myroides sp. NP-2]MBB1150428.1 hypothetical protein [Myroides sp. NP-2]